MTTTTDAARDPRSLHEPALATGAAFAALSPTEVAVALADQMLPSSDPRVWGGWPLSTTGRRVDVEDLAILTLGTLIGALLSAGAIQLSVQEREGWFSLKQVAYLQLLPGIRPRLFPHQSPEARVIAWLATQPQRAGWLDEVITGALLTEDTSSPVREWNHEMHHGMVARRQAQQEKRTVLLFIVLRSYHLMSETAEALGRVADDAMAAVQACRDQLHGDQLVRCRKAWRDAISLRTINNAD